MSATLDHAIKAAADELRVHIADTEALRIEAFKVRHQVYCIERGYEAAAGELETDSFDASSDHVVLARRADDAVIGTVRLVKGDTKHGSASFPMDAVCPPAMLAGLPLHCTGEVSRFSLSKERRGLSSAATSMARLALVRGVLELAHAAGITHWVAMMEPTLLRLLRATGIHFTALGPAVEYHGLRQPAHCYVPDMLARMRAEQPAIWAFVTDGGRLATPVPALLAA